MQKEIEKLGLDFYAASKIYLPYIDSCDVEWYPAQDKIGKPGKFLLFDANQFLNCYSATLLLRPIDKMTDEEVRQYFKYAGATPSMELGIITEFSPISKQRKCIDGMSEHSTKCTQYLYSIGIALPYLDYTIEQLVSVKIYKLI